MMQENSEDKMFKDLLSEYANPTDDNGFTNHVLNNLPARKSLKRYFVGVGAMLGGAIAMLQLPTVWKYISSVKLPALSIPEMNTPVLETTSLLISYGPVITGFFAMMFIWLASTLLLSDSL